ncbi:MAG: pilus assembly protein [Stenotrophomonas sp.]
MNHAVARTRAVLLLLAGLMAAPAHANLSVHPMRLPVQNDRGGQIRVHSQTSKVQYVQTRVLRVEQPATPEENEVELAPGLLDGVVVTPGKFVLSGGGSRLVRVIPLASVTEETVYRVYFEGVAPPSEVEEQAADDAPSANVGVSLVWGALVHLMPAQPVADMQIEGSALHNIGNVRLGITGLKACDSNNQCAIHELEQSVYPGSRLALPFDPAGQHITVSYRLSHAGYRNHQRVLAP